MNNKIKAYFVKNYRDHIDEYNEINCTSLAEDAIDALDVSDENEHIVFDAAVDFSDAKEKDMALIRERERQEIPMNRNPRPVSWSEFELSQRN